MLKLLLIQLLRIVLNTWVFFFPYKDDPIKSAKILCELMTCTDQTSDDVMRNYLIVYMESWSAHKEYLAGITLIKDQLKLYRPQLLQRINL